MQIRTRELPFASAISALVLLYAGVPLGASAEEAQRASSQVIEEITVTARKREERAIDAPVAVTVMGAEELDRYNTRDLTQLTARVPGLQVDHGAGGGAGGNITIRGIGKPPGTSDYGIDAPVSIWIDGMPFSRNHMILTGFFDSEAVEVLKGPQAVYFGKNSPSGVIAIRSKSPEVGGEFEGFVRAQYEFRTEDPQLEAGFSLPVGDHWAFRLAARGQDMSGGWLDNLAEPLDASALYPGTNYETRGASYDEYPAQKQSVVRFTAVWEPTENFDATLKMFRSYTKRNDAGQTTLYACADGPGANPTFLGIWADPTQSCPDDRARLNRTGALAPLEVAREDPIVSEDGKFHYKLAQYVHTLQLNWEVGDFTVSSSTGYWDYRHREHTAYGYTSWGVVTSKQGEEGEAFTQEVRVASNFDGPINFTVGGFYENAERSLKAPVQLVPSAILPNNLPSTIPGPYEGSYLNYHQVWDNDIDSWSAFATFDWQLTEQLDISGGLRYTKEDREAIGGNIYENAGFFGFSPAGYVYNPKDTSDNLSPEITVSYHFNDDLMVYGGYRTGFQSAGISNPGTVSDLRSLPVDVQNETLIFDETTIKGFEAGLKGTFMDGRLRTDMAAFWYESEDLQVGIFNSNTTSFTLQNAAVAHNWGFEANAIYQVNDKLQLRAAGQFNHLEFDEWEDAGCHPVDGAIAVKPTEGPGCYIGPDGVAIQDLSGVRYGGPPLQINVGFTYEQPLASGWYLALDWDTIHHTKGKRTLNQPFTEIPSRTVTHVAARLMQDSGPWEASLICSNCFNEIYVTSITNRPLAKIDPGVRGDMVAQVQPPRLITFNVTYRL
jgi:outer membrane receptor protein involved in Fe transport